MYFESLKEILFANHMTKEECIELFDIKESTFNRWNNNPPYHVVKIIKLIGLKAHYPESWKDWYFDREFLVDPAGNSFSQNDIMSLFGQRELSKEIYGSRDRVKSLKLELEKKIKKMNSEIKIKLVIGDNEQEFNVAL